LGEISKSYGIEVKLSSTFHLKLIVNQIDYSDLRGYA
jgi:hypothetical protein